MSLNQQLNQLTTKLDELPRVAVVGIGNTLRNDDGAGILVARELTRREHLAGMHHVLVIQAGHAPENVTGELREFDPDLILLVDAAEFRDVPGAICWVPIQAIEGMSASTHSLPLSMLARYLTLELHCDVALIGIQPKSNDVGEVISVEVQAAVNEIVNEMCDACLIIKPAY
ncbi:MAG TPA: hydrogenase 3 maturation endopeptidase HyCI [Anaerolineales bacterium]|nr:hydrogenase 3 maturation endopeptidase HyCI [Anaerolineales bacterium]HMX19616.1 hydrogenase 3 maturation endopeptidase HyCI [Anaerolineales bacterium]HMX74000.1 hydrogenase 3 maturation endopeptidase HyCI [Anaerolineales bacterium]HMZ43132.1 hydrogenase 3 maturation endopeptidase HyCI [Anaerolineales bacterium]HNA54764.1 hydrogenase 3 maturation endopeptidase HyCI [Anaerolineales bacterium]